MIRVDAVWLACEPLDMCAGIELSVGDWQPAVLNAGRFVWPKDGSTLALPRSRLEALVLGLRWQRIGEAGVIRIL